MFHDAHDWALVLAAGEGSRLRSLTTTDEGVPVPKQFCSLDGGASLLQEALHRAESVAHFTRVCTVVAAAHRPWWAEPLQMRSRASVVIQPRNRGTAIGILLPLLHLARRDPRATVALLPSDHFVENERALARALRGAMIDAATYSEDVLLLGIRPDHADPQLGYIVPRRTDGVDLPSVAQFVEKPCRADAERLIDRGALWNSFIVVARLESLLALYERRFDEVLTALDLAIERELAGDLRAVTDLYERLPDIDFSRHVLAGQEEFLRIVPVPACGWSDLGTPRRVAAALRSPRAVPRSVAPHITPAAVLDLASRHGRLQLADA
jgi:mannose-1-phosphate guanylyltransferase